MNEELFKIEKLSTALRFAITAAQEFDKTPGCDLDMTVFHNYKEDTCFACLAGAAVLKLAKNMNPDVSKILSVNDMADTIGAERSALRDYEHAINFLRTGWVNNAAASIGIDFVDFPTRIVSPYRENPEQFFDDLTQLADDLEAAGC